MKKTGRIEQLLLKELGSLYAVKDYTSLLGLRQVANWNDTRNLAAEISIKKVTDRRTVISWGVERSLPIDGDWDFRGEGQYVCCGQFTPKMARKIAKAVKALTY